MGGGGQGLVCCVCGRADVKRQVSGLQAGEGSAWTRAVEQDSIQIPVSLQHGSLWEADDTGSLEPFRRGMTEAMLCAKELHTWLCKTWRRLHAQKNLEHV